MAIEITDKHNCTGCSACYSICPTSAIDFIPDNEGFFYPTVNTTKCIECGLCEKVCPPLNLNSTPTEQKFYAAINTDSVVRELSTSGGVFTPFAEEIIKKRGVVFGVAFNDRWLAYHTYAQTMEEVAKFRISKYMQSEVGDTFAQVKEFLDNGRWVLFSGTPCQADGLRRSLRKEYEKLIIMDCICYGVPSPLVFTHYLNDMTGGGSLQSFSFRSKKLGWRDFSISYDLDGVNHSHPARKDPFIFSFMKLLSVRPSCFNCPDKSGRSHADITIADLWGVENIIPEIDDNRGCSMIIINSHKGGEFMRSCLDKIKIYPISSKQATKKNPNYHKSAKEPKSRKNFMDGVIKGSPMATLIENFHREQPLCIKIRRQWKKIRYKF